MLPKVSSEQWVTSTSKKLVEERNQAKLRYRNHRNDNNKLYWRQAAERVELSLTTDRENYYEELCATAETAAWRNDQREIYSIMNKISGKSRRNVVNSVRMRNGNIPNDPEESLNEWAEYFTELLNDTTTTSGGPLILRVSTDLDISVKDFTEQEFTRALTQCKFGKSPDIDIYESRNNALCWLGCAELSTGCLQEHS